MGCQRFSQLTASSNDLFKKGVRCSVFGENKFRFVQLFRGYQNSEFRPPNSAFALLTRTDSGGGVTTRNGNLARQVRPGIQWRVVVTNIDAT